MKAQALCVALSFFLLTACRSAPPPQAPAPLPPQPVVTSSYPNLMVEAKQLETALGSKDYAKVIDLTYPKVVEVGGGREKLLGEMTKEMQSMEAQHVFLLSSTASDPTQYVTDANGIYAVVPVT